MFKKAKYGLEIIGMAIKRFLIENYTYHAATLAFTTLLTIVPILLIFVYLASAFPLFSNIVGTGEQYIYTNFVPVSALEIETHFKTFVTQAMHLPTLSIVFLFLMTVTLLHTLDETLNKILRVPSRKHSRKIFAVFVHWLIFMFIPFIVGTCILFSSYLITLLGITKLANDLQISSYLFILVSIAMNTIIFSLFYIFLPNIKIRIRYGLTEGLVAAILFEILKILFALYMKQFSVYSAIYGAFAIIPIFLIWLYLFWCIFLFAPILLSCHLKKDDAVE